MSQLFAVEPIQLEDLSSVSQLRGCLPLGRTYLMVVEAGEDPAALGPWWVRPPRWARRVEVAIGYYDVAAEPGVNDRSTPGVLVGYMTGGKVGIFDLPSMTGAPIDAVYLLGSNLAGYAMQAGPVSLPVVPDVDIVFLPSGLTGMATGSEVSWSFRWFSE